MSCRGRVLSRAGIGVLTWVVGPDLVDEAVGDGLAWEMRLRALPSRLGVYFVLGLCLFSYLPYGQVLRELVCGLDGALGAAGWRVPASTALTGVRDRIGGKPLESLFRRLCPALAVCSAHSARWLSRFRSDSRPLQACVLPSLRVTARPPTPQPLTSG